MPTSTAPVEVKVKAATAAATVLAVIVTVLNAVVADSALLGSLPGWLQAVITLVTLPLATFYAGWKARHTPQVPEAVPPADGAV
ncbi:holin [Streptomyces kronopolitis]|uniref:holin n=1 Tax=Streptomyces kronopolitis TaxID=1612435 RepID=UPI003D952AC4